MVFCLHVYLSVYNIVPDVSGDQKRALNHLELDLQRVLNYHVGARTHNAKLGPLEDQLVL